MLDPSKLKQDFSFIKCELECANGWLKLIYDLSKKLKDIGFNGEVIQIKEKFGGLRYYFDLVRDKKGYLIDEEKLPAIDELVYNAERKSYKICELCGKKGKLITKNYWYRTRCPKCEKQE
jgi:hypothetical protein